ncbi:MAG TPA: type I-E CRISPR-associated endonuclease Cas1e [Rubricoccaceae bacterium]|nr:type I-E CRISPR-associated endonuclease Cas1e [Rubricoccaceae bacterium]
MPENLRALPKLRDSISTLYLERGRLTQSRNGVEFENDLGRVAVPVATLCALLLGPGTTVTHRAVHAVARSGCSLLWVGEEGVRLYASGHGETRKAYALQEQARLSSDPTLRLKVVERMYRMRFGEPLPAGLSLQEVRGHEGARVRRAYREAAERFGIDWRGRRYDREDWDAADPVNRALSAANACLNGVCHAAVVSAGYSPGLGFIHQGKQLAFVYDIADLYKTLLTVPIAFATAAEKPDKLETVVRKRCRDAFRRFRLLDRILPEIRQLLDLDAHVPIPDGFDPDDDAALPTVWWGDGSTPLPVVADGAFGDSYDAVGVDGDEEDEPLLTTEWPEEPDDGNG